MNLSIILTCCKKTLNNIAYQRLKNFLILDYSKAKRLLKTAYTLLQAYIEKMT